MRPRPLARARLRERARHLREARTTSSRPSRTDRFVPTVDIRGVSAIEHALWHLAWGGDAVKIDGHRHTHTQDWPGPWDNVVCQCEIAELEEVLPVTV